MNIDVKERYKLYEKIRTEMGAGSVSVNELKDNTMDILLEVCLEDYSQHLNNWLIKQKWGELQNLSAENSDLLYSLMTKTLDFERDFSNAYSRQVELASGGNYSDKWTLEIDYVEVTAGTQTYIIPENREISSVLWLTPPTINKTHLLSNFSVWGAGWTNVGSGGVGYGTNTFQALAVLPIYGTLSLASNISMREYAFQSPLTYRVTQFGKKKKLWLYPVPASRYEPSDVFNGVSMTGTKVWYFYYNTANNRDECVDENKDHIILLPSDVKLEKIKWSELNDSSKNIIRKLLSAKAKRVIGRVRGKFNGILNFGESTLEMDYRMYLDEGKKEEEEVYTELNEYLKEMEYQTILEKRANIAKSVNEVLKLIPPKNPLYVG